MYSINSNLQEFNNPLDLLEDFMLSQEWAFERRGSEEMAVEIPSRWCDLGVFFAWAPDIGVLHVSCAIDIRINDKETKNKVYELLAKANQRLIVGHFALWGDEAMPIFKYSMLFDGNVTNANDNISKLVKVAVNECEKFYPAFQYVIWGGKTPEEALYASLLETYGEA